MQALETKIVDYIGQEKERSPFHYSSESYSAFSNIMKKANEVLQCSPDKEQLSTLYKELVEVVDNMEIRYDKVLLGELLISSFKLKSNGVNEELWSKFCNIRDDALIVYENSSATDELVQSSIILLVHFNNSVTLE
ncbi:MAG: hypothetical protein ACRCWQ_00525 [Bacilli bacterium]